MAICNFAFIIWGGHCSKDLFSLPWLNLLVLPYCGFRNEIRTSLSWGGRGGLEGGGTRFNTTDTHSRGWITTEVVILLGSAGSLAWHHQPRPRTPACLASFHSPGDWVPPDVQHDSVVSQLGNSKRNISILIEWYLLRTAIQHTCCLHLLAKLGKSSGHSTVLTVMRCIYENMKAPNWSPPPWTVLLAFNGESGGKGKRGS